MEVPPLPQRLQEDAGKGGSLCAAVDQSYQALEGKVNDVTARLLKERIEGEHRRLAAVIMCSIVLK